MQPIETRYHGHRFRSRLEARWAVFFDAFGLQWEYEPEGYDLGELGYYLPDFVVQGRVIVEVKPPNYESTEEDWDRWNHITELPGIETFFLASGLPAGTRTYHGLEHSSNPLVGRYALARCEKCYGLVFARMDASSVIYTGARLCSPECPSQCCEILDPECEEITRATYARFEHGETPAIEKVIHRPRWRRSQIWRERVEDSESSDILTLPPERQALYLELQTAIAEMRAAPVREKRMHFDRVADLQSRWNAA